MTRALGVAFVTRKPFSAALEFNRDDVVFAVVVGAAGLVIEVYADDFDAVNVLSHRAMGRRCSSLQLQVLLA